MLFPDHGGRREGARAAVDHPYFRTMYDTFHANIEEKNVGPGDQGAAPAACPCPHQRERPRHAGHRPRPLGRDVPALREVKYDGWMVSSRSAGRCPHLAAATKVWRDLFPSPEEVYTKGLAFMKEKWGQFA